MLKSCLPFRLLFPSCYSAASATDSSSSDEKAQETPTDVPNLTEILGKLARHFNPKTFQVATELPLDILEIHLHHLQFTSNDEFEASEKDKSTLLSLPLATESGRHLGYVHVTKEKTIHIILDSGVVDQNTKEFDSSLAWLEFGDMRKVAIHNGFYLEAKEILQIIYATLETAKNELKLSDLFEYQIILGGHGFAAGVAAVLALFFMVYSSFHDQWLNQVRDCDNKHNRYKLIATGVPNVFIGRSAESNFDFLDENNFILYQNEKDTICRIPERAVVEPAHPDSTFIFSPVGTIRLVEFSKQDLAKKRNGGLKHSISILGMGLKRRVTAKPEKSTWSWLSLAAKSVNHDRSLYIKNVQKTLMEDKSTSTTDA